MVKAKHIAYIGEHIHTYMHTHRINCDKQFLYIYVQDLVICVSSPISICSRKCDTLPLDLPSPAVLLLV